MLVGGPHFAGWFSDRQGDGSCLYVKATAISLAVSGVVSFAARCSALAHLDPAAWQVLRLEESGTQVISEDDGNKIQNSWHWWGKVGPLMPFTNT